ncbi:alpha/beta hydrolase [Pseudomonas sp. GCM10022186]|uniref:alpha/beta hydrolase n=1 Tax=Pseudomonas sp. GCM10022186 TaxID=3252650 RepID=UPI00362377A5
MTIRISGRTVAVSIFMLTFFGMAWYLVVEQDLRKIDATLGEKPLKCFLNAGTETKRESIENNDHGTVDLVEISSCGGSVRFYEAIPKNITPKTPLVVALHQTTNFGKGEVMGYAGNSDLFYGRSFYEDGFIVIAPDIFLAGDNFSESVGYDTKNFYKEYPDWSATGRMLEDHKSVVRYARKFNPRCMGVVGHSLGGHNALFLAAFDKEIDVVVSSGGFTSMASDKDAIRWARESWFVYMPLLRPYVSKGSPRVTPWDFDDLLKAILPRSVLIIHGRNDESWSNNSSVPDLVAAANAGITSSSQAKLIFHEGGHEFGWRFQDIAKDFVLQSCARGQF